MDSITIKASIANWEAIRPNSESLIEQLDQGNYFMFEFPSYPKVSPSIHAYPGVYEGKFYFFLIPSEYDKEEYSAEIDLYTTVCEVKRLLGGEEDRITEAEAKRRINAWKKNYKTWVPKQVESPIGIFMAFSIPSQDFECLNAQVNFGLKVSPESPGGYQVDLVITNNMGKEIYYDDFVTSVPPFSATILPQNFYLLPY